MSNDGAEAGSPYRLVKLFDLGRATGSLMQSIDPRCIADHRVMRAGIKLEVVNLIRAIPSHLNRLEMVTPFTEILTILVLI